MPSVSSLGVGSNIDAESIVKALVSAESQPLKLLQDQEADLKTKVSSFGKVQSLFSDLEDASQSLASVSLWNQTTASSSDSATVSASSSSGAASGSYSVTVQKLATSQTATSTAFASSSSTLSAGTLTIELGTWTGDPETGFTAKSGSSPVSITIGAGETSLSAIRDKINAANAGVTASIINDASGARLSIRSTSTGAENAFRITATEDTDDGVAGTGLSALGYDATAASPMTRNQKAINAQATINGISVTSASNTLENVADGLTVKLLKESTTAVDVTVGSDTDAVRKGIDDFVKAFNALATYIHDQTQYNADSKNAGPLQGDRTAVSLQNQLRAVLNMDSTASSKYARLIDIGLVMKADGTLETKSGKLDDAMDNLSELRKLFATDGTTSANSGFMVRYRKLASAVLDTDGALDAATTGLNNRIKTLDKREAQMQDRLDAMEKRLREQYQALDTKMGSLNGLSSYISQQISALNK